MEQKISRNILESGTGYMIDTSAAMKQLQSEGYKDDLIPCFDHLECRMSGTKLFPEDFDVVERIRFENTSDPDDQSILYVIEAPELGVRGLYLEAYGLYHDDLSPGLSDRLRIHH